jgi:hypothetical protein
MLSTSLQQIPTQEHACNEPSPKGDRRPITLGRRYLYPPETQGSVSDDCPPAWL